MLQTAVGKSKKLSKRNAALAMLNAIRLGGVEPNIQVVEPDEYEDEDPIALVWFDWQIIIFWLNAFIGAVHLHYNFCSYVF